MFYDKKLVLILCSGIGLSLAAISALYLYRRRDDSEDGCSHRPLTQFKVSSKRFQQYSQHIRVPKHLVPAMIGRKGENIKALEAKTKTAINFESEGEAMNGRRRVWDSPGLETVGQMEPLEDNGWCEDGVGVRTDSEPEYRLMTIRGPPEAVATAVQLVGAMIAETASDSVSIPNRCNVVGQYGQTIEAIRDRSGARVRLFGGRNGRNRSVVITGSEEQRAVAKQMVAQVVEEFYESEKKKNSQTFE